MSKFIRVTAIPTTDEAQRTTFLVNVDRIEVVWQDEHGSTVIDMGTQNTPRNFCVAESFEEVAGLLEHEPTFAGLP